MNDIFENAKFGDKFRTRDGRKAIFVGEDSKPSGYRYVLTLDQHHPMLLYFDVDGCYDCEEHPYDIIGKWEDEDDRLTIAESKAMVKENTDLKTLLLDLRHIDEEGLDRLAFNQAVDSLGEDAFLTQRWYSYTDGFKAGYRKAKSG